MATELTVGHYVSLQRGTTYKGHLVGSPGPALLGLGSIIPGGGFRIGDYKTYGGDCPQKLMLHPGDLFVSLKGATKDGEMIGSVARVPPTVPSGRLTQDTVKLEFRSRDRSSERYLYWVLRTPHYREYCASRATGSAVVALSRDDFLSYPVPPVTTRRMRVVDLLEDLEEKIDLNRQMSSTLEAMARSVFESWFVDFDPVRANSEGRELIGLDQPTAALFPPGFMESDLGPIPAGWDTVRLSDLADVDKGLSYKGDGLTEAGGVPMVNLGCFTGRGIFNADRIKRYTGAYRQRHLVHPGDLVIANTDMTQNRVIIGSPALVPEVAGQSELLFTHHVFAVRFKPTSEIWRRYVYFTLLQPGFREIAEGFSTGTTVLALPRDGLLGYKFCIPPEELLLAFERVVLPILSAVQNSNAQSRALTSLRDAILPKLLSDDIRIPDAMKTIESVA